MKRKLGALLLIVSIVLSFAIPVYAQNVQLNGIDVSEHQGTIDWTAVKNAGVQFAMIRDGYGGDLGSWDQQTDKYFQQNYSGATQNGIKVGVFHYSYATNVTMASQEADECLYILQSRHLDYPVAYDVENACQDGVSSDTMGQIVQTFCSKIQSAGYQAIVYTDPDFYKNHLPSSLKDQYNIWIANWGVSTPNFDKYTMWQYTNAGHIDGITGQGGDTNVVDMDYSYVDYASTSNTNPSSDSGNSGNAGGSTTTDPLTFRSDTSAYTFGNNSTYIYKITTPDTFPPTAASSNASAVSVSGPTATNGGYLFTLKNVGAGDAVITTTAGDGRSVSFHATGTGKASSMKCDTSSYTFGTNSQYLYKITTSDSTAPAAKSSNPSAVSVSSAVKTNGGYLFTIYNKGKGSATITTTASDGTTASFVATGTSSSAVQSDTPYYFTMKKGSTYQFKFTGAPGVSYSFSCANHSVIKSVSLNKTGGNYYFKVSAIGNGCAGMYASAGGSSQRVGIITVR